MRSLRSVGNALRGLALVAVVALAAAGALAQAPPANQARLDWMREARFGMFIHWGPVSLKGTEIGWSRGAEVPIEEYDNLYKQFNPVKFDPDRWCEIAKAAGMKYIVLTTKHHDGFCLFNTKQTDYNVMQSAYGRDVTGELAAACRRHGLRFGTYYSVCDWHHPAFPFGSPGGTTAKPSPDLEAYTRYLKAQVRELITQYGPLQVLWFDVSQGFDAKRGQDVVDYVRSLQPDILVNNRCSNPGDFQTPEQQVGTFQMSPPWESCITIANQWAWRPNDEAKSLRKCLQTLILCAGGDGNLLLNVGPNAQGEIEPLQAQRLAELGQWLGQYGESVYGTRGGPYKPSRTLASTRRGRTLYLHLLSSQERVVLPPLPCRVASASVLTGGKVRVTQRPDRLSLRLTSVPEGQLVRVVKLNLASDAMAIAPLQVPETERVAASNYYGHMDEYAPERALDGNLQTRWATDAGTHQAWLAVDLGSPRVLTGFRLREACGSRIQHFQLEVEEGGQWRPFYVGTQVGAELQGQFEPVAARRVRLNILEATEGPTVWEFELFPKTAN